jgi:predicted aspartyl protease
VHIAQSGFARVRFWYHRSMGANAACFKRSSDANNRATRLGAAVTAALIIFAAVCSNVAAAPDRCLDATAVSQPILAPAAAAAQPQGGQTSNQAPDQTPGQASGEAKRDGGLRMVAPVNVAGQGPFPFIIDTGANRTAISRDLADRLGVAPDGAGEVNSVYGVTNAPLIPAQRLEYAALPLPADQEMPVITGAVLAGQAGLLGVDSMRGKRLRMDFERRCIEISTPVNRFNHSGWTTVRGSLRFGSLIVVQGTVRQQRVNILVDTGSDSTLANVAFRDQLARELHVNPEGRIETRAYTMGQPVILNTAVLIPSLEIGDLEVGNVMAYVGDFHVFQLWDMTSEPTLLIGMDVLSRTRAVVIDFSDGSLYFELRPTVTTGSRIPMMRGDAQIITR